MLKSVEELKQMNIKEQEEYFKSLPLTELKNYYGGRLRGMLFQTMNNIYIRKKAEAYKQWSETYK